MHPSLRLEQLEKLPAAIKTIATSAAQSSESDILELMNITQDTSIPDSQKLPLLPAFYAVLDPARIPTAGALEIIVLQRSARTPEIGSALLAIGVISGLPRPDPATHVDIWARTWAWIDFAHTYMAHLRDRGLPTEEQFYFGFMHTIVYLLEVSWDLNMILSTPGIRAVVARSWVVFLDGGNTVGLECISKFLYRNHTPSGVTCLDEFIDGAGGTVGDLALTVVRHINRVVNRRTPLTNRDVAALLASWTFFDNTASLHALSGPYEAALLVHGVVGAITAVICALNPVVSADDPPQFRDRLLSLLSRRCLTAPGYPWVAEALQAGLLRAIVSSANVGSVHHMEAFLTCIIPNSMVYRTVLVHIPKAMDDVQKLVDTQAFRHSPVYQPWLKFEELVDDRIRFLSRFTSENYLCLRACDNMQCGRIQDKRKFKRCSGCLEFCYCSRDCQSFDWKAGHREVCTTFRHFRLKETLGTRDLSFLRELASDDFLRNQSHVLSQTATWLASAPALPLFTTIDYSRGSAAIKVKSVRSLPQDPRSECLADRSSGSGGKLALHQIILHEGAGTAVRFFRMRFESTQLYEEVRKLARSLTLTPRDERKAALDAVQRIYFTITDGRTYDTKSDAARCGGDFQTKLFALFSSTAGTTDERDTRTLIEACPQGWWYSALLPSKQRLVAFHCDASSAKGAVRTRTRLLDLLHDQTDHLARIVREHEYDLSAPEGSAPAGPQATAACSAQLEGWQTQPYFIPVGDTALSFDPLSSQGMMTALEMGCIVGTELAANLKQLQGFTDERGIVERLVERYAQVWAHFENSRKYYYSVQARFEGEQFWASRRV
ncbi:hypothetical protein B0H19DRAFT_1383514 [Mycena capillaripes]|nr:hypothetical protein B0H19DRAFT_1383514 [Mycena capillaripes]